MEACIILVKCTIKKCCDTNSDKHLALLQIRMMPIGPGLPNTVKLLFNQPTRGIMPIINRIPISKDNDDEHHKALLWRQTKNDRKHDTTRNYTLLPIGSTVVVQREDGNRCTHGKIVGKGDHHHHDCDTVV